MKKLFCMFYVLILVSCCFACNQSNSSKLYNNVINSVTKVEKTINNLYIPTYSDLIIPEFIDESSGDYINLSNLNNNNTQKWHTILSFEEENKYQPKFINNNISSSKFNTFVSKLENLNLQMNDTICAVSELTEKKNKIFEKLNEIKQSFKEIKNSNIEEYKYLLSKELTNEIVYLCNNLTNKEDNLKAQIKEVVSLKNKTMFNTNSLSNSYVNIVNNLDNKISNIDKIYVCYNQIMGIVNTKNNIQNHYIPTEILENNVKNNTTLSFIKYKEINNINKLILNNNDTNEDKPKIIPLPYIIEDDNNKNDIEYL